MILSNEKSKCIGIKQLQLHTLVFALYIQVYQLVFTLNISIKCTLNRHGKFLINTNQNICEPKINRSFSWSCNEAKVKV